MPGSYANRSLILTFTSLSQRWQNDLKAHYEPQEISALLDLVLGFYTGLGKASLRIYNQPFSPAVVKKVEAAKQRLFKKEPVQYILGETEFFGLNLKVSPGVLIPRPETEELVSWILEDHTADHLKAIDLCSGSGCIAFGLKANRPLWEVSALELSEDALEVLKQNALELDLQIDLLEEDLFKTDLGKQSFDIIVSNPPYVRKQESSLMDSNVLEHEPHMALFVEDEDPFLFYRRLAALAQQHLKPQSRLYLEINEYLSKELQVLLKSLGFTTELRQDAYLKDRMIKCQKK